MTSQPEKDEDMSENEERTNLAEENADRAAESEDNTQVADAGVPGQIMYPDREADAARAGEYAAGKRDTLYEEDESGTTGWTNPAERSGEVEGEPGVPGDESGEETEPEGVGGNP